MNIQVTLADEPEYCTAHGLDELMSHPERYENVDLTSGAAAEKANGE